MHLKILRLFLLTFWLFPSLLKAQKITGKIISLNTQKPIPYARIGIPNTAIGSSADKEGAYQIRIPVSTSRQYLTIEAGGYESLTMAADSFVQADRHNIALREKIHELENVVVKSDNYTNKHWGIESKSKSVSISISNKEAFLDSSKEFAIAFTNKKRIKLLKININTIGYKDDDTLLLGYDIYSMKNGLPDTSILSINLTDTLTKDKLTDGTFSFDVEDKKIWINKQNFFVSVRVLNLDGGSLYMSGALLKKFYYRNFFEEWHKISLAAPALNIEVKVPK